MSHNLANSDQSFTFADLDLSNVEPIPSARWTLSEAAIGYAILGFLVFPLHGMENGRCTCGNRNCSTPGKHPRKKGWQNDASKNEEQITTWWKRWPNANIGIATGARSDLVVVDIDSAKGRKLVEQWGWPDTVTAETGKGVHLYFFHPGHKVSNSAGAIGDGLDVRGDGGYVVAPPSVHANGKRYRWADGTDLVVGPIAEMPDWVTSRQKRITISAPGKQERNYALAALEGEASTLASTIVGKRNDGLNTSALKLGRLVAAGYLDRNEVERALFNACKENGLLDDDGENAVRASFESGFTDGLTQPRIVPGTSAGSAGAGIAQIGWEPIKPMPAMQGGIEDLPARLLPEALRAWLVDVAERGNVPLQYVAVSAIVALSSLVGRTVGMCPKRFDTWRVAPNLWGAIVGRPGVKKSHAIAEGTKPLHRLAEAARARYGNDKAAAESATEVIDARLADLKQQVNAAIKSKDEAEVDNLESQITELKLQRNKTSAHERRYIVNDTTVEKLGEILNENPRGVIVIRDELTGFFRSLEKSGHENDRAFYLEAWTGVGGDYRYDRIARGSIHIKTPTVSIIGSIQPKPLDDIARPMIQGGGDGFIQRFQLMVFGEQSNAHPIDRAPDERAFARVVELFMKLDVLEPSTVGAENKQGEIPCVRFSDDAQVVFDAWNRELAGRLRDSALAETPAFEGHLAKYPSLMASLALLFHLIDCVDGGKTGPVSAHAADQAVEWCEYLERHARRIYSDELFPGLKSAHALIAKIKKGRVSDGSTVREIYNSGWALLKTSDDVWAAIELLEETGHIKMEKITTNGRPSDRIRLHPDLKTPK